MLNYFPTTGDQLNGCVYYNDRDGNPITAVESGTVVKALVTVAGRGTNPPQCIPPVKRDKWYDIVGWLRYAFAWLEYQKCLRG